MDGPHLAHLVALVAWGLVVVIEGALELRARTDDARRRVAMLHYRIDVFIEIPLLAMVLATGAVLLVRAWPPSTPIIAKVVLALVAIGLNAYCAVHVVLRRRRMDDPIALAHHGRRVLLGGLGIPAALVAAWIGLASSV